VATVPADTDALSFVPAGDTDTHFVDDADDFMAWHAGILDPRPLTFFREDVTVADAAGLDLDAHVLHPAQESRARQSGNPLRACQSAPPSSSLLRLA